MLIELINANNVSLLYKRTFILCPRKRKDISPFDFTVPYITHHIFFVHTAQLMTHSMHWDISENRSNKPEKQLAINLKSLGVLVLAL